MRVARGRPARRRIGLAERGDQRVSRLRSEGEVVDAVAREGGPEQRARVFPGGAVAAEDRVAEERVEDGAAVLEGSWVRVGGGGRGRGDVRRLFRSPGVGGLVLELGWLVLGVC